MNKIEPEINFTGEFFVPGSSGRRMEEDHMARYSFASHYAENKSVLDIACGVGYSAPVYIEAGAKSYHGVDLSSKQIQYAKQNYGSDIVSYSAGDICNYYGNKQYDLISCFETIEHVPDYVGALKNLFNLLAKDGTLLISSPNRPVTSPKAKVLTDKPGNEYHTQEFTANELTEQLKNAGFNVEDIIYGQRQGRHYSCKLTNQIYQMLFGNPKKKSSAKVTPVTHLTPRYFIIIAHKQQTSQTL